MSSRKAYVKLNSNQCAGRVRLENVSDEDAAKIMAIVSYESKIPLNQLYFKSIKLLPSKEAK